MLKIKNFIILITIYLIALFTLKSNINLFYPYYLIKDLIFSPVLAIEEEVIFDDRVIDGVNLELKRELDELKEVNNLKTLPTIYGYLNNTDDQCDCTENYED